MLGKRVERERELRRVGSSTVGSDGRTDETSSDQPPSDQVGLHATAMVGSAPIGSSPDRQAGLVLVASQPNYPLPAPNQSPNSAHPIRSRPMAGDLRRPQEEPIMFSLFFFFFFFFLFAGADIIHPSSVGKERRRRRAQELASRARENARRSVLICIVTDPASRFRRVFPEDSYKTHQISLYSMIYIYTYTSLLAAPFSAPRVDQYEEPMRQSRASKTKMIDAGKNSNLYIIGLNYI